MAGMRFTTIADLGVLSFRQRMSRGSGVYCQPYCQRRGNEGNAGDWNLLRISKLLIPKSLRVVQKPIEGSNPSLSAIEKSR